MVEGSGRGPTIESKQGDFVRYHSKNILAAMAIFLILGCGEVIIMMYAFMAIGILFVCIATHSIGGQPFGLGAALGGGVYLIGSFLIGLAFPKGSTEKIRDAQPTAASTMKQQNVQSTPISRVDPASFPMKESNSSPSPVVDCKKCKRAVILMSGGICPSCQHVNDMEAPASPQITIPSRPVSSAPEIRK